MVQVNWTESKKAEVLKAVENYIVKNEITCGETVMQTDKGQIKGIELCSDIADIIEAEYIDED